jgi:hypothetical protein
MSISNTRCNVRNLTQTPQESVHAHTHPEKVITITTQCNNFIIAFHVPIY